jgi:hypothetical protein
MTRIGNRLALIGFAAALGFVAICMAGPAAPQKTHASAERGSPYYPLAVGNWWLYTFGGHSKRAGKTLKWSVTDKAMRHGTPVYSLSSDPSLGDDEPLVLSPVNRGVMEADIGEESFLLKYPLKTGARWEARLSGPRFVGKLDSFQVVSEGKGCTVGAYSFDHCVTVREADEVAGFATVTTYARGVGPVKEVYFKGLHSKEIDTTLVIKSWKVH